MMRLTAEQLSSKGNNMAVTTINTTPAQDARMVVAFGNKLGLGRNATAAEIKQAMIDWLTRIVIEDEARVSEQAGNAANPFTPT
jgi:hypothetical protein